MPIIKFIATKEMLNQVKQAAKTSNKKSIAAFARSAIREKINQVLKSD